MAISFSKPDPSSPAAVGSAQFNVTRRGFDQGEVRDFLRMVSAELARLQEREKFLESEMRAMQTRGLSDPGVLDEATVTTLLGEETARVLSVAREAAQQMRERAAETAEQMVRDAANEVARMREEAEIEVSRRRNDASSDSEAEIELAKQQGREMVNEARAYREKLLTELATRRELARQQIEELIRHRDRLKAAFERASLAASGAVGDLTDFDAAAEEFQQAVPVVTETASTSVTTLREDREDREPEPSNVLPFDREKFEDHIDQQPESFVEAQETKPEVVAVVETSEDQKPETVVHNDAETRIESSQSPDDEPDNGHRAKIVQMFGRTSRRLHPSTDTPEVDAKETPTKSTEEPKSERTEIVAPSPQQEPTPRKTSVDDLFAKLRSASAETVASSVKHTKSPAKRDAGSQKKVEVPTAIKPDVEMFERRDNALSVVDEVIAKKLKRVLADEENSVLNYLQTKKAQVALEKVLPSADNQLQNYVDAISKELIEVAMSGARSLSKSLKADLRKKISNTTVMQVMSKKLAEEIVYPLRERIQKCVVDSDGSSSEMSSLIRTVYREWKMQQIDKLVGDISRLAYSRGAYLVIETGTKVCWMVDPNGPPCSDAEDNSLAGEVACGEKFPTGHDHPVIHSGCKCLVVPAPR
ncbi:MAG: DivIVA domain-containing protein [Actinobacteria bacterium]|nr:DivIVA domain-containing protein [Actinomycetota bacterium]